MMSIKPLPIWLLFGLLLIAAPLHAEPAPTSETTIPAPPALAATAYLLQDFNTGKVLAESHADDRLPPASLTKIVSVYVIFREIKNGHLKLDDMVTISKKAWQATGSRMFLDANSQVTVEDLLKGVIIQSGNDASIALAEHVAGNETTFADMMNQNAQRLGMVNSHFVNSDGLPIEGHYTTARDLAIITTALIKEFPEYYPWFSQKDFTYNKIIQQNRNMLLSRDASVDGVKTGHTEEAGYCLVASALRENTRLISVVMGTKSTLARANENQNLLNYGFRFYESHKLYDANTSLSEARVWKGAEKKLPLGVTDAFYATTPRGRYNDLKADMTINNPIVAPVKEGDKLGNITVTLKGEVIANTDLVALKSIDEGNMFQRIMDSALMMISRPDANK